MDAPAFDPRFDIDPLEPFEDQGLKMLSSHGADGLRDRRRAGRIPASPRQPRTKQQVQG